MFRPSSKQLCYLIQKTDFSGDVVEPFLQAATGNVYVVAENGFFFFNKDENKCEKIATPAFLENKINLPSILNDGKLPAMGTCYLLKREEADKIIARTYIGCCYTGFADTTAFEALLHFAKTLILHDSLLQALQVLSVGIKDDEFAFALLRKGFGVTTHVDTRKLDPKIYPMLQGLIDWEAVPTVNATVDLLREAFQDKTPQQIVDYFKRYCGEFFNDSVLAEKWEKLGNTLSSAASPSFSPAH